MENDTGKAGITRKFRVDNRTGPILVSSYPVGVGFYNDVIKLTFDRKVLVQSLRNGI